MIYKSKPFTVDAYEILSLKEAETMPSARMNYVAELDNGTDFFLMPVNYGQHTPKVGDYLIMQNKSDRYVCPADVFKAKYELDEAQAA